MKVQLCAGSFGWDYILESEDGRTVLVQTDWDYSSVARNIGWSTFRTQKRGIGNARCHHDGTDGTVDCDSCGVTASAFIAHAHAYLDRHVGDYFDDPGYFTEDT